VEIGDTEIDSSRGICESVYQILGERLFKSKFGLIDGRRSIQNQHNIDGLSTTTIRRSGKIGGNGERSVFAVGVGKDLTILSGVGGWET
jgi:hypothetical protein